MSKSMLVIDTPKSCKDCMLLVQDKDTGIWWCIKGFPVRQLTEKPDYCPLEPYHCEVDCNIAADGLTEMIKEWDRGK